MCKKSTSLCQVPRARAAPADYGNNSEQTSVTGATGNLPTAEPFQLCRNLYQPPCLEPLISYTPPKSVLDAEESASLVQSIILATINPPTFQLSPSAPCTTILCPQKHPSF